VAEVVVPPAGADEQRIHERPVSDDIPWPISPAWGLPERPPERHRSEQQAAIGERIVPVAAHAEVTARRPVIARRDPDEAGSNRLPEARQPDVARLAIDPHTGRVETVVVRRRDTWAVVHRCGWLWQIGDFRLVLRCPEAGDPAPAVRRLLPIPLHVPLS